MESSSLGLTIGNRQLATNIALAPLAGTSDVTFRTLCHEQGAGLVCTELVSARGIRYNPSLTKSFRYLEIDPPREGAVAIQLFGYEAQDFETAIPLILEHPLLGQASFIDLNMGCPVPKVVKTGAGSALMKNLPLAASILETSVKAAQSYGVPVTVKFRKGWDEEQINCVEFAQMCRDYGAAAVTVHGRTRAQMYQGKADWEAIAQVVAALRGSGVKVFANGDVKDGAGAASILEKTQAHGVMVGRGAQGNPWIFAQIVAFLQGRTPPMLPSPEERAVMIRRHLTGLCSKLGEETAVKEMRADLACYFRGQPLAAAFKHRAMMATTYEEVDQLLTEWTAACFAIWVGEV